MTTKKYSTGIPLLDAWDQLDSSLEALARQPSVETAVHMNIASMRFVDALYTLNGAFDGTPEGILREYSNKVREAIGHIERLKKRTRDHYTHELKTRDEKDPEVERLRRDLYNLESSLMLMRTRKTPPRKLYDDNREIPKP